MPRRDELGWSTRQLVLVCNAAYGDIEVGVSGDARNEVSRICDCHS